MSRILWFKELFFFLFFPIRIPISSIMGTSDTSVSFNRQTDVMAKLLPLLLHLPKPRRHHCIPVPLLVTSCNEGCFCLYDMPFTKYMTGKRHHVIRYFSLLNLKCRTN